MSAITPTDKLNILFNKYLGYADISGTTFATRWTENASETIYSNNIYFKKIPDNAPSILLSDIINVPYKKAPSLNTTSLTYVKEYSSNPEQAHIVKYTDVQLYGFEGNPDIAFYYNDLSGNPNLLKGAITDRHTRDQSYTITVKRQDDTYVAYDEYILDSDAGIIVFYNTDGISRTEPPKITFWRYEGPVGLGYDASNVYLGTNAALINQQPNAIAIGTNAGRDTQGSNAIAIGANAGYTSQHANSIILNASDASLNSLTPGFFINPIREIDTTAGTITPISYYNPITKELQYGKNTWYSAPAESVIDMSGNKILRLAEPTDPSGATTKSYVDTAISNITTYLADPSTAWYNIRAGTNVDLSANRIINLADPSGNSDAVTKNYVDTAVYSTEIHIGRYYNSQLGGITLPYDSTTSQGYYAIGIGYNTGLNGQQENAVAIGRNAGRIDQSGNAIAIGLSAGCNTQGSNAIAIGLNAGYIDQSGNAISLGQEAGRFSQNVNAIAIGQQAGFSNQSQNTIAIGQSAGNTRQNINAIAIGQSAGWTDQSGNAIAIGNKAAFSSQSLNAIAIGQEAGRTRQNINAIAIGQNAGTNDQSGNAIAIGQSAGNERQNVNAIAIGQQAGLTDQSGNAIAIGQSAGYIRQNVNAIAIGQTAGFIEQSGNAIAIGKDAAVMNQGSNSIAIGQAAGYNSQGSNAIALGTNAGKSSQSSNSIILNATGLELNTDTSGLFIDPIRQTSNSSVILTYNTITKEIQYANNDTLKNPLQSDLDMSGNKIIRLAEPIDPSGAATKYYVDSRIDASFNEIRDNIGYDLDSIDISLNTINSLLGALDSSFNDLSGQLATSVQSINTHIDSSYNDIIQYIDSSLNTINSRLVALDSSFNDLSGQLATSVQSINTHIDGSYNDMIEYVDSSFNTLKQYVDSSLNTINSRLGVLDISFNDLSGQLASSVQSINSRIDASLNVVNTRFGTLDSSYNDLSGQLASSVQSINLHIDSSFVEIVTNVGIEFNNVYDYIDGSYNDMTDYVDGSFNTLKQYVDSSLNTINSRLGTLDSSFNDLSGQLALSVQSINRHIDASFVEIVFNVGNEFNSVYGYIDGSYNDMTDYIDGSYNTLKQYVDSSLNTINSRLGTLDSSYNDLSGQLATSVQLINSHIDTSYNSLKSYVDSSLNNLTTYIDTRVGSSITSIPNWSTVQASTTPDLSNNRIINVADPSNNQDVATKNYVDTKVNPLDQWLTTYLLSQPPAIDVSANFSPTSSEIGFFWTLPEQISVAFSQQKFPVINELYADISGVAPVFTPPTTTQYVPGTSNPVTLLILSKSAGNSGYQQRIIGGKTYNAYVYYNSSLSTAGSTIYVTVYYKNSSSQQPNKVTVPLATFMQGYPPSAVRSISATPSTTSAVVQWTAPEFIDTTPGNQKTYGTAGAPGYATPAYTLTYQPTATSKYGGISGLVSTTNIQDYSSTIQSYTQNSLYAGTTYRVTITAKNDVSSTSSPDASGTFTTTLPSNSVAISGYNIPFAGNYNRSSTIQNVSNTVLASTDLIFYNTGSTVISSTNPITLAVTNSYNPGSTSATAMTLEYDASNKLTVGGFPSLTASSQGTIATSITTADMYQGDPLLNNLIASVSFTLQLALPSPASSQKSSMLTHKINSSTVGTKTYTYYVDSLPTTAQASISGTPTYTISSLTQKTICGIPIYGTATPSQQLTFNNITVLNQGKYFYYQGKLFTVSIPLMSITNSAVGTLPASPYDASGAIVSPLTYPTTQVTGTFSSSSYSQGMPYTITPFNINNLSTPLNASVPIIVDAPSANKAFPASEQSPAGSTSGVEGMRFSNPADLTSTSLALTAFNHSTLLTTNSELLYANGRYRYKESTPTYLINYSTTYGGPNYSALSGTTRYAMFSWTISNSYASQIQNLKFQIQNLKSGMITGVNSQTNDIVSSGIELYYKFQEFNGATPIPITDSSAKTTVWINAFQVNNAATAISYYQNSTNNLSGGFNVANSTLTDLTNPVIGVNGWSFKPSDILSGNTLKIYVRIGFSDSALDAVFSQINCSYT